MSRKNIVQSGRPSGKVPVEILYKPYFQMKGVYFTDDSPYAFVNKVRYTMDSPSITRGDNLLVAADSLVKIYGPEMKGKIDDTFAKLTYRGNTVTLKVGEMTAQKNDESFELEIASEIIDGHFYLDVEAVMGKGFEKAVRWERSYVAPGDFLGIGDKQEDIFPDRQFGKDLVTYLDKKTGVLRRAYYFEEGKLIQPYLLYIPYTYDPAKPTKLAMVLHGAGGGVGDGRDLSWQPTVLETAAQKHNMILLFAEGYAMGFYGAGNIDFQPQECDEDEKPYIAMCEHEPLCALEQVKKEFNIDEKNVFIVGNSMGGGGTFWLAKQYPEIFRACAPCGSLITHDLSKFDLSPFKGKGVMMVVGTENVAFDNMFEKVEYFKSQGADAVGYGVPGGVHGSAWVYAFDKILDFFEEHSV